MNISIATDFSDVPWGRYPSDGIYCGQNFRDNKLVPALKTHERVTVNLDGVEGLGSSFLDETFGGMVRKGFFTTEQLKSKLTITTSQPEYRMYVALAWNSVADAKFGSEHPQLEAV